MLLIVGPQLLLRHLLVPDGLQMQLLLLLAHVERGFMIWHVQWHGAEALVGGAGCWD